MELNEKKLSPILLVPPGAMSKGDMRRVGGEGGVCVVECKQIDQARFLEPPSVIASLPQQAQAALQLFRQILSSNEEKITKADFVSRYVKILMESEQTPRVPSIQHKK